MGLPIRWNGKSAIWRQYVKYTQIISEHPGYRHIKFTGEEDAKKFFDDIIGLQWEENSWAKYLLRRIEEAQKDKAVYRNKFAFVPDASVKNTYIKDPNNYEYMVRYYIKQGIKNIDQLARLLKDRPEKYRIDYNKLRYYINKYTKSPKQSNPDRFIIVELIKVYYSRGLSIRKIEEALREDNIDLAKTQVHQIMKEEGIIKEDLLPEEEVQVENIVAGANYDISGLEIETRIVW